MVWEPGIESHYLKSSSHRKGWVPRVFIGFVRVIGNSGSPSQRTNNLSLGSWVALLANLSISYTPSRTSECGRKIGKLFTGGRNRILKLVTPPHPRRTTIYLLYEEPEKTPNAAENTTGQPVLPSPDGDEIDLTRSESDWYSMVFLSLLGRNRFCVNQPQPTYEDWNISKVATQAQSQPQIWR